MKLLESHAQAISICVNSDLVSCYGLCLGNSKQEMNDRPSTTLEDMGRGEGENGTLEVRKGT